MKRQVPFYRLKLTEGEIGAVARTLRSGWLTSGEVTRQFENEFADYIGSRHALAVNSCTAALHLSLIAAGVGAGDEVITTPYTFVASAEAIIHSGATPRFVDTQADSLNIDLDQVSLSVSDRTKAILPVHIAGDPCDLRMIARLRKRYNLKVIHDAAHALGSSVGKRMIGATPDFTCFSFYATKNLTTGEGGMITMARKCDHDLIELLRLHGMSKEAWKRYADKGNWKYQVLRLGYKYNISDINSALGLAQLRRFDTLQRARRRVVGWYRKYLRDVEELSLPQERQGTTHAWHLYIVRLRHGGESYRNSLIERLKDHGVGTSVHFIPLYLQPYFQQRFQLSTQDFPNATAHYQQAITLPLYPDLKEVEVRYIADVFKHLLARQS